MDNKYMKLLKNVAVLLISFYSTVTYTQEGSPFIANFFTSDQSLNENYSIAQSKEGVMILANRKGLLTFDADEWQLVKTPEVPYVVALSPLDSIVYVGCKNDVGYLHKTLTGSFEYVSINNAIVEKGVYMQIAFSENNIFFLCLSSVVRVDAVSKKIQKEYKSDKNKPFTALIAFNNSVAVDVFQDGLYELTDSDKKLLFNQKSFPLNGEILFSEPFDQNRVLLGTTDNTLFLFDGAKLSKYDFQDKQFVQDGILVGATSIDQNNLAIATGTSGCIIVDKQTGKTRYSINFENGLPDDQVLAIGHDKNKGIWLAHYYGLTRIDTQLPVRNFSSYMGLSGNIQTSETLNNKFYVATSNGIFLLEKKRDYVDYIRKQPEQTILSALKHASRNDVVNSVLSNESAGGSKQEKGGVFSRLFSKNKASDSNRAAKGTESNSVSLFEIQTLGREKSKEFAVSKKVYKLQPVSHSFSKVEGFNYRCKQMVNFNDRLLVASNMGLFEIIDNKAINVIPSLSINYIYIPAKSKFAYACTEQGIKKLEFLGGKWNILDFEYGINENIYSFAIDVFDNYWIGSDNKVIRLKIRKNQVKDKKEFKFTTDFHERVMVRISNKKPLFFLTNQIYAIFNDSIQPYKALEKYVGAETDFFFMQNDYTWIRNQRDWVLLRSNEVPDTTGYVFLNLFNNVNHIFTQQQGNMWVVDNNSIIYQIDAQKIHEYKSDFSAFIKSFTGNAGDKFSLAGVALDKNNHSLNILISAPYFVKSNSNQYQYFINGLMTDWSSWNSNPEINFIVQKSGNYEMKVRARNIFGNTSNEETLRFNIKPAFYETWWFYTIIAIVLGGLVYLLVQYRTEHLKRENQILEQKVKERTQEIQHQKEEIEDQRNHIAQQNLEITDSIRYAKRLQVAVMPDNNYLDLILGKDYFIIFRPKDIVSGDFYWFNKIGGKVVACAADCTGHGVPGGFLSMLGISLLNELSATDRDFKANDMLNYLRLKLKHTLIKDTNTNDTKDGMDIALCIIDKKDKKLEFAGANNPLWLLRDGQMLEYKADKMPIGSYVDEKESFTNNNVDLLSGDILYIFSDGFRDQIGGPNAKRMKSSSFREALIRFGNLPMNEQKQQLEKHFDDWRGEFEQIDDILVIGIKI